MYDPCYHCKSGKYDPEECPQICRYGEMIREQAEHQKAVNEWRAVTFPVNIADHVYLLRRNHGDILSCTIHTIRSRALGGWTFRLANEMPDWLCNAGEYYEVNLAQFGKTWFKDLNEARTAQAELRKKRKEHK